MREPFLVLDSEPAGQVGQSRVLQDLPRRRGRDRRPLHLRPGQRPVGHPRAAELLEEVLPQNHAFDDFEVEHEFPRIGQQDHAAQRPPRSQQGDTRADPARHRGHHRAQEAERGPARFRSPLPPAVRDGQGRHPDPRRRHRRRSSTPTRSWPGSLGWTPTSSWARNSGRSACSRTSRRTRHAFRELQARRLHPLRAPAAAEPSAARRSRSSSSATSTRRTTRWWPSATCATSPSGSAGAAEQAQAAALADEHRRKDEFLAMLCHELRNPLAPIRSAVHLLRSSRAPAART